MAWLTDELPARRPPAVARRNLIAPGAVVAIVGLMIVPLPPLLLDLLLSIDIGLAVVLLLTAIYVREPVEFSVFPSLLLVLTLLRLSLNVAGTRLDPAARRGRGRSGRPRDHVVRPVRGRRQLRRRRVVFLVLIAIQFIVINHGAVRISEVTARFTLDAMPGKQMAIDADLNAGLIDEQEARERRETVRREADFYGAMDGAIRFTQRDALAAMLITGVNIVAGLVIGVLQHGMDLSTAAADVHHPDGRRRSGDGHSRRCWCRWPGGLITTRAASESQPRRGSRRTAPRAAPGRWAWPREC